MWTEAFAILEVIYQTVSLVLWLISQVKETLTNVDEISKYCVRALAPGQPVEFDHRLFAGLKPATRAAYVKELVAFHRWLERVHLEPRFPSELDAAVNRYLSEVPGPPSRAERLLAALEKAFPQVKGKLAWSTSVFIQLKKTIAVAHTLPMPYEVALMLAYQMAVSGWARVGGVLLLQWLYGLRPSEALGLSANDLVPASSSYLGFLRPACLLLAPKRGTKSGRPQHAQGCKEFIGWADTLIAAFKATTPAGTKLCAVIDTAQYQRLINRAAAALRLRGRYSPHSPRAGWASSMRLWGLPFSELQERGRWASASSLRIYLDFSATLQLQCDEQHIMTFARWLHEDLGKRFPWWH